MSTDQNQIPLAEVVKILGQAKLRILGFAAIVALIVFLICIQLPNVYAARSLLLPPQQGQSSAGSALAALGVLGASLGGAASVKTPEELYVGLLKADSLTDNLIERFKLQQRYGAKTIVSARKAVTKHISITAERKSGLIRIEVEDSDPVFAANVANSYTDELKQLMNRIAITEAAQRRLFFEEQAKRAKDALAAAESAFKLAQEKYGIQSIDVRAQGDIRAASDLRAQMMMREIQMQSMRVYAGPDNPDIARLAAEISSMRAQLSRVEQGAGADGSNSEAALANQRAYREVKYQESILGGLIAQAEIARSDEARQAPLVQQVDVAVPPDAKSFPNRPLIVVASVLIAILVGAIAVLLGSLWNKSHQDPMSQQRWREALTAWRLRRT